MPETDPNETLREAFVVALDPFDLDGGIATHSNAELADACILALRDWLNVGPHRRRGLVDLWREVERVG